MKRALVVRHVAHEGLAGFAPPLADAGYAVEYLAAGGEGFGDADLRAPDLLVILGGPMAVYEREQWPWMAGEIARVATRIAAGGPTLGLCLGSQVIAAAMGAAVAPGRSREVGFAPVTLTEAGLASPLSAVAGLPLLHWHGDGFAVPDGATLLAFTEDYPQAFAVGDTVLALQCHPEMGGADDGIGRWIAEADGYIEGAGTDAATILADHARYGQAASRAGSLALAAWLAGLRQLCLVAEAWPAARRCDA